MPLPLLMMPPANDAAAAMPYIPPAAAAIDGLYLHVPFCFHKCHYCDFYSITRQSSQRMEQFVDLIFAEANLWLAALDAPPAIRTIFIGGGTPSLLPINVMDRLLTGVKRLFDLSRLTEWTIEVNPATAEADYCRMLREHGVDRLSFGAQSFNIAELAVLERHHEPADVLKSLDLARSAGFERLNIDLIYAIPGQTLQSWEQSLAVALQFSTPHISAYNLTYEPNTPMAVRKRLGHFTAVEESLELQMFHFARARLSQAGLAPYEISNYAIPGQACQHNVMYWTGGNYIGLGPSAASHVDGHRHRNRPHLGEWEAAIRAGKLPATDVESLSPARRAGELAMLMLRLARGLNYADFTNRTGLDACAVFADPIDRLTRLGLLAADDDAIRLTEAGVNVADAIAGEFLEPA